MEDFKNLTIEQLRKVVEEINKELCNRKIKERKNVYENLINAMKDFQKTEYYYTDTCYLKICCQECDEETEIEFFEYFDSIIEKLESDSVI